MSNNDEILITLVGGPLDSKQTRAKVGRRILCRKAGRVVAVYRFNPSAAAFQFDFIAGSDSDPSSEKYKARPLACD